MTLPVELVYRTFLVGGVIILSVSIVKPRLCSESSTAAMWLVVLCMFECVGFLRGQPGVALRSAKF